MRADCFEALLAAVYLTRGLEEARRVAREVIGISPQIVQPGDEARSA